MTADDEERCGKGGMETTYDVIFEDGINRAMFIEQVLEVSKRWCVSCHCTCSDCNLASRPLVRYTHRHMQR